MKKSITALFLGATLLSGCGDATEREKILVGGITAAGAADLLGANENVTAVAAVTGAILLPLVTRAQNAGCKLGSRPSGSLIFRSNVDGAYLNCESVGLKNPAIQALRKSPEWTLLTTNQTSGQGRGSYIFINGFN